ncbi:hypothetical protein CS022_21565 [Veronia nyctiphanis]|uniref:Uncharacterized protein n=1 Tax=Veronia nyctiphanis TaxID=1278244 RepID=A0A4Q0YK88_9GAMM|nr:hypothetical protein [Veronia nyctiphanis]RXJ71137.1 hypothetical protein CS022_21565 [Veronia nyctiphanis]
MDFFTFAVIVIAILSVTKVLQIGVVAKNKSSEQGSVLDDVAAIKAESEKEIAELRERIEVLEKIVTEKNYNLDQQIRSL